MKDIFATVKVRLQLTHILNLGNYPVFMMHSEEKVVIHKCESQKKRMFLYSVTYISVYPLFE